jgi:hypothetical protein
MTLCLKATTLKTLSIKEIIDKCDFIKRKTSVCKIFKRMRREALDWEEIFGNVTSDRGMFVIPNPKNS